MASRFPAGYVTEDEPPANPADPHRADSKTSDRKLSMGKKKKKKKRAAVPKTGSQIIAARLLLVVASAVAGYLAWGALSGGSLAGCGPSSGCDKVLSSRWAYWLGIPVSLPAIAAYLALLAASFSANGRSAPGRRFAWLSIIALSMMITGAVFWFTGLQVFVLNSFCKFCFTAHGSALIAAALLLKNAPVSKAASDPKASSAAILFRPALNASLAGLAGVAVLASGQVLVERGTHKVKTLAADPPAEPQPEPEPARELALHKGTILLNLNEVPMLGSPEAPHVIVSLFDYTCHYCRDMHGLLLQAKARFTNQLAIATLPMPLDKNCNHIIRQTPVAHVNACEYAKFGLAVWRAKKEAFGEFDSWVFEPPTPPGLAEVKQHAIDLVGREELETALSDDWIQRQLRQDVAIYEANYKEMRSRSMPQLILGQSISVGAIRQGSELYQMISDSFGLR